jgi:hypothetical protein
MCLPAHVPDTDAFIPIDPCAAVALGRNTARHHLLAREGLAWSVASITAHPSCMSYLRATTVPYGPPTEVW